MVYASRALLIAMAKITKITKTDFFDNIFSENSKFCKISLILRFHEIKSLLRGVAIFTISENHQKSPKIDYLHI